MSAINPKHKNNWNINKMLCKIVGVDIQAQWVSKQLKNKLKVKFYWSVLKHLDYKQLKTQY